MNELLNQLGTMGVVPVVVLENAADACQLTIHPGEHAYHLPSSLDWFSRWCLEKETI